MYAYGATVYIHCPLNGLKAPSVGELNKYCSQTFLLLYQTLFYILSRPNCDICTLKHHIKTKKIFILSVHTVWHIANLYKRKIRIIYHIWRYVYTITSHFFKFLHLHVIQPMEIRGAAYIAP